MLSFLTTLTLALGAQGAPAPAPQEPAAEGAAAWQDFDGVALIVNDQIVTFRELDALLRDARQGAPATTADETSALLAGVAENTITKQLQTQAGRELGIPTDAVAQTVERYLSDERRDKTAQETESWLADEGAGDLGQLRRQVTSELYRTFWVQGETGRGVSWGRPYRDRYVRPGQLHEAYVVNEALLSDPNTYRLQFLVLPTAAWGDPETARAALQDFRTEIEGGADMGALVDEYGAALRETRGITDWLTEPGIKDESVRAFVEEAAEGALSPVLEFRAPSGAVEGFQLVRVVARIEGQGAPTFQDAQLQTRLEDLIQSRWDEARLTTASDRLWQTGYIRGPSRLQIMPPWVRRSQAGQGR